MRRVIYSVAASLDGYIAGAGGEFDWIPMDPEMDWTAFMGRFDTVLMGRRTYEIAVGQQPSSSEPGMRTFVFSRTLRSADHPNVTLVAEDAKSVVDELRRETGKEIWLMGGGDLFRSLLEAGAVDSVEVGLVPILLGQGLPLLPPAPFRTRLALTKTHTYPSGIVMLSYDVRPNVKKARAARPAPASGKNRQTARRAGR
jgi:dihydrofolate reductase